MKARPWERAFVCQSNKITEWRKRKLFFNFLVPAINAIIGLLIQF
jgi:hypothetical protein